MKKSSYNLPLELPTTQGVGMDNGTIGEKGKKKSLLQLFLLLKQHVLEFTRCSSLHGLRYIGEAQRPKIEKFFWLISFLTSVGFVSFFIVNIYKKWESSPVFVSFADTMTPVWDIPFPAITICPQTKIRSSELNFTALCHNLNKTEEQIEDFEKAKIICRNFIDFGIDITDYFPLGYEPDNSTTLEGMDDFLGRVGPLMGEMLDLCRWRRNTIDCADIFQPVITDNGLCYTANNLNAQQMFKVGTVQRQSYSLQHPNMTLWSYEDQKYKDTDEIDVYPQRALTSGSSGGLVLLISLMKEDTDRLCTPPIYGAKVTLTNPADYPAMVQDQYFRIDMDRDVVIGIKPRVMATNMRLKDYDAIYRQCYFSTERQLRYFNVYTQQNCNLECLTNYTLHKCGCVSFYMPRSEDIPVCNWKKLNCTDAAKDNFSSDDNGMEYCYCLPGCTEIKYDIEISQAVFKPYETLHALYAWSSALGIDNRTTNGNDTEDMVSSVAFYYKDNQFVTSHRSELYGPIDFLASCGGLLGLYLGFSFLSLVEIIYFFTMRLVSNVMAERRHSE